MDVSSDERKKIKALEKEFRYRFKKISYLKCALTHKSYTNERRLAPCENNERYEFLGDAVLELCVSHLLMARFPDHSEGVLSKFRAAIVNENQLSQIAIEMNIGDYLYLGKGEEQTGGRQKASLLSDAFEAILGAIYLDRGFDKVFKIVEYIYDSILDRAGSVGFVRDYKTKLQEESQRLFRSIPRYKIINVSGPDHCKEFEINLYINNELMGAGTGYSKKSAEQSAAQKALDKLLGNKENNTMDDSEDK